MIFSTNTAASVLTKETLTQHYLQDVAS